MRAPEHLPGGEDRSQLGVRQWLVPMPLTALLVVLGLVGVVLLARAEFGSVRSALSYLRGARLIPRHYSEQAGTVARGEEPVLEFDLKNWSGKPITVLGAKSTCTCLSLGEFPIRVLPQETKNLKFRLRTKKRKPGPVSAVARLFTDEQRSETLILRVTAVVR